MMTSFSTLPLSQFIDRLARPEPTPGGGTASAVTGALGTALLVMVAGLAKSRNNTGDEKAALARAREALSPLLQAFQSAADRDAAAFDSVLSAYRLPKTTDEEKGVRQASIQQAYREATRVPLETLEMAARALDEAVHVARHGNRSAASDVGVAALLLAATAEGAAANVRVNLGSLSDAGVRARFEEEARDLSARAATAAAEVHRALSASAP
jgi:formiminotetrahydrofolate cyclodeaminase